MYGDVKAGRETSLPAAALTEISLTYLVFSTVFFLGPVRMSFIIVIIIKFTAVQLPAPNSFNKYNVKNEKPRRSEIACCRDATYEYLSKYRVSGH